jgi:hypothetical protein
MELQSIALSPTRRVAWHVRHKGGQALACVILTVCMSETLMAAWCGTACGIMLITSNNIAAPGAA